MKGFLNFFLVLTLFVSTGVSAQKVTLSMKNAPIRDVMLSIYHQAGYYNMGDPALMKLANPVTIDVVNRDLIDVLKLIVSQQPFTYQIDDHYIFFTPKSIAKTVNIPVHPPSAKLHGTVLNTANQPIGGVTVLLKERGIKSITDGKGQFNLSDVPKKGKLILKYMNYEDVSVSYEGYTISPIHLRLDPSQLNETIIRAKPKEPIWKGYYPTSQLLNTGNVGMLKSRAIGNQPINNPLMALNGRITGLYATPTSGIPGAYMKVNIQGPNSMNGGNEPLYIIDRVPFSAGTLSQTENAAVYLTPFAVIDPADIENITVLKGADATAIYGSRGANGVILITTKKGKAGKTILDINVNSGCGMISNKLNLMNTTQYLRMRKEAFKNDFTAPGMLDYDLNGKWNASKNTDWQEVLIGGLSHYTNAKITLSGGNKNTQFLFGAGYKHETNVFPGEFASNTGTANLSVQHTSKNKKFQVSNNTILNYNSNRLPRTDPTQYIMMAPIAPEIYNTNEQLNWENNSFNNPLGSSFQPSTNITKNILSNFSLSYELLRNFNIEANVGYNRISLKDQTLIPSISLMPSSADPSAQRMSSKGINIIQTWIVEPQLSYKINPGKHIFDALLGTTFQENRKKGSLLTGWGFGNDAMLSNTAAATTLDSTSTYSQYRYNAVYSRLGYNYKEKYVLNLTGRMDGSSRFSAGKNFGIFWSVGGAWIFSNENFFKERFSFLSLGKIRGSIGKTGNDQIPDYQYLSIYERAPGYFGSSSGLAPTQLSNPNFFWENIKKSELALELAFNNRGALTLSIFRNKTTNQLFNHTLPATTGFINIIESLPVIIENKGLEAEGQWLLINHRNFTWDFTVNLTIPKNRILSYPDIEQSGNNARYPPGSSLTNKYVYQYLGVDAGTGTYKFKDRDKNNTWDQNDKTSVFSGQKYFGGIANTLTYKGFSLDMLFQFVNQRGPSLTANLTPGRYGPSAGNQLVKYSDNWQQPGDQARYQKFSATDNKSNIAHIAFNQSDAQIVNTSFLSLKNIALSWTLPKYWTDKCRLQKSRIYLQGQNIFTFSKYDGLDPESAQYNNILSLPSLRVIIFGLQISL